MIPRRKSNSSKVNLIISAIFHSVLIFVVFFFAAREGMLGKKLKQLTVTMVPKEKKPEPPKEKAPEQKAEQPKPSDTPKQVVAAPKVDTAPPPPAADTAPSVAPAAVDLPSFAFSDGAKDVTSLSDPNAIFKALVEYSVKSHWNRPEDMADENYKAEVELTIDPKGRVTSSRWLSGSGNSRWDASVKSAVSEAQSVGKPPPKGFPPTFVVRFDVETTGSDTIQMSSK